MLTYLGQLGIVTILVVAQSGLFEGAMKTAVDVSYLADTLVLLRYFETAGKVRQALSVVKKRRGNHERSIHEFRVGPEGIHVGPPIEDLQDVLTGLSSFVGTGTVVSGGRKNDRAGT